MAASSLTKQEIKPAAPMREIGVAGSRDPTGLNRDEFLPRLRGQQAIKVFREMRENDAIVGAVLNAMDMMLRAVDWRVEPADDTPAARDEADFVRGALFVDMSHSWEVFISEVLSMLPFGFDFHEAVYKRRVGPTQVNPSRRSRFTDGRIGVRKLAPRAQWTVQRFSVADDGGVRGIFQDSGRGGREVFIPIEKGLLFRTTSVNNAPAGRSVLRNAYKSYYYANHVEMIEAIAIERELAGLPVGRVPGEYLSSNASAEQKAFVNAFSSILRDVKNNEQGFVMLPSDLYETDEGVLTSKRLVEFELMASSGTRAIDTGATIVRHQQGIARTVLADFLMLGGNDRGSFAMSRDKSELFQRSLTGYVGNIAATVNRHLLPRLWALNGLDFDLIPEVKPGTVAPVDLQVLGEYIQRLSGAGVPLFPDGDLEAALRGAAGLPQTTSIDDPDLLGRPGGGGEVDPGGEDGDGE